MPTRHIDWVRVAAYLPGAARALAANTGHRGCPEASGQRCLPACKPHWRRFPMHRATPGLPVMKEQPGLPAVQASVLEGCEPLHASCQSGNPCHFQYFVVDDCQSASVDYEGADEGLRPRNPRQNLPGLMVRQGWG